MTTANNELGHVFLVEDDTSLASLVEDYFTMQGFKVTIEGRGDLATARILAKQPDVVILDIMLPGKNGLDICRELRAQSDLPVIMLTARTDEIDQIVGLEVGADDYICKPVQPRLLLARINALLRRAHQTESNNKDENSKDIFQFGQLAINKIKQEVFIGDEQIDLTTNELELLCLFAAHADQVLSRDDLLNNLRGFGYDGLDRTVDMLVSRLRKKLHDSSNKPQKIKTVWKKGYLFVSDAWQN
ncbi:response regulator [Paraneptunicella aestuarii]|uniref:response regulator n=1 Tax=Paraneptunicella aestuarii TaxID=2831148 RepID=UPI001E548A97|nr:response regulator [Paraneptunicella aestuarii]UAA38419.1 response regulator [Paraneptunicella aestuarii]